MGDISALSPKGHSSSIHVEEAESRLSTNNFFSTNSVDLYTQVDQLSVVDLVDAST